MPRPTWNGESNIMKLHYVQYAQRVALKTATWLKALDLMAPPRSSSPPLHATLSSCLSRSEPEKLLC